MTKISIVGCGKVGSTIAFSLLPHEKIDELVLIDVIENLPEGLVLDMSHAYPEFAEKLKSGKFKDTENSDIIIIAAGKGRTKESTRMELLETNKEIFKDIMKNIKVSDRTVIIIVTNPVEPLTYLVYKLSNLANTKVIGFGNILDTSRLTCILSKKTGAEPKKIKCYVIGEHGENMLPVFSQCFIDGRSFKDYKLDSAKILQELKTISKDVIRLLGWTQYGPAKHVTSLVNTILNDMNDVYPVSFFVKENNGYGLKNVCISLPVEINRKGVGEIITMDLNTEEKKKLQEIANGLTQVQKELI